MDELVADGLLARSETDRLRAARVRHPEVHPLALIAREQTPDARTPERPLSLETLTQWLAHKVHLPYFHIDPLKIDVAGVTAIVSYAYATRNRILPVSVSGEEVVFATAEPFLTEWEQELAPLLRRRIRRVVANPLDIERYLVEFYSLARSVRHAATLTSDLRLGDLANLEQLVELGRSGKLDANDQHVINIVDWLLQYAFDQRASDIHLEPRRDQGNIRFRIDGILHLVYQLPVTVMGAVTSRIKILGRMDLAEKRRPLDGRIKTKTPEGREIELRLSTIPTAFGEKLVMRIFDPEVLVRSPQEMGLSDDDLARWQSMTRQPHGIVLVTGPTGSGKTTTLYSTLKQLALPEVNVCTIEDPIEMVEPTFNQIQVHPAIGLDFASGVRSLLRQDPDIIMVGEIRDRETAEMAVQAALTGHLVLSTLHTNDASTAVTRLLDIGIPAYLINATLLGVMAQRLVRRLCPHCKQPGPLDEAAWQELVYPWKVAPPATVYAPRGCLECRNTGFLGRTGLFEIMVLSPALRQRIGTESDLATVRELAMREGMRPLRLSGAEKVSAGITTIAEVIHTLS